MANAAIHLKNDCVFTRLGFVVALARTISRLRARFH